MGSRNFLRPFSTPIDWNEIEESSPEKQIEFLSKWKDKFQVELISSDGKNVKKGDHLAVERYKILKNGAPLYTHHAICTGIHRDKMTICEYGGNISGILHFPQGGLQNLAKIQYNEYDVVDLEKKMAYKVVWPKELRRYGGRKVSKRAKERKDEKSYHLFENNCEHFATWCKCGLNVSLQAQLWCLWARQIVEKIVTSGNAMIENIVPVLLRVLTSVSNTSVVAFAGKSFAESLMSSLVEKGFINQEIISDMKKVFDEWMNNFSSDELLLEKLVRMIKGTICSFVKATCNSVGSMAGSVYQTVRNGFGYESADVVDAADDVCDGVVEVDGVGVDGVDGADDGCSEELFNEFIEWCNDGMSQSDQL